MNIQFRKWAVNRIAEQRRRDLEKRLSLLRMARVFESPSDSGHRECLTRPFTEKMIESVKRRRTEP